MNPTSNGTESLVSVPDFIEDDCYFLSFDDAYRQALRQVMVDGGQSGRRLQYCYYDGPLTDITLPNLIQIPGDGFVEQMALTQLPIPTKIVVPQGDAFSVEALPQEVIDEILQQRNERRAIITGIQKKRLNINLGDLLDRDCYFIDPLRALNEAKKKNRVYCGHPTIDGLQVCFHRGQLPAHELPNLVRVELEQLVEFGIQTKLRLPEKVEIPAGVSDADAELMRGQIEQAIALAKRQRYEVALELAQQAKALRPRVVPGQPLRVYLPTSRLTTVMQYNSRDVARAFARRGFEVLLDIEADETQGANPVARLKCYLEFNPHITFYVNQLTNHYQNAEVVNICWWQDLMPQIKNHKPLPWRDNDYVFSYSAAFDRHLQLCGAPNIVRQSFAIDEEIFNNDGFDTRQDKVVFAGSAYLPMVDLQDPAIQAAVSELLLAIDAGQVIDQAYTTNLAERLALGADQVFWKILHYVVRDHSVKWLCRHGGESVEIYGRYWEQDSDVAPFYRGEISHGPALAEIYRSARYALVSHPFEINSQRLAEVAACGCIPIVYDCRAIAEAPHWDRHCLFFKTEADLRRIVTNREQPECDPCEIARQFTYAIAVDNFITHSGIQQLLECQTQGLASVNTARQADCQPIDGWIEPPADDLYFTDFALALRQAEKCRAVEGGRFQYCYYDGALTTSALPQLIRVERSEFAEFFVGNDLPLPRWVVDENAQILELQPQLLDEIAAMRLTREADHPDTDFFDALEALNVAKQGNIHRGKQGQAWRQICYYHGDPLHTELDNLIHVDLEQMVDFFVVTRTRFPSQLRADPALLDDYQNIFAEVELRKQRIVDDLKQQARQLAPNYRQSGAMRVMLLVDDANSRLMDFAHDLDKRGYDVWVYLENDALHEINAIDLIGHYLDFQPHLLIQDNHCYSDFLHADMVNLVCWSEAAMQKSAGVPVNRDNDFHWVDGPRTALMLKRSGARNVVRRDALDGETLFEVLTGVVGADGPLHERRHMRYAILLRGNDTEVLNRALIRFDDNLKALEERGDGLWRAIESFLNQNTFDITAEDEIDGEPQTLALTVGGGQRYVPDWSNIDANRRKIAGIAEQCQGKDYYGYCLNGAGFGQELATLFDVSRLPVKELPNVEIPIYVLERQPALLLACLVAQPCRAIFTAKRVRIFLGENALADFKHELTDFLSVVPGYFINAASGNDWIAAANAAIGAAVQDRRERHSDNLEAIAEYYRVFDIDRCRQKFAADAAGLRVMGLTTRFTSFLQYCVRDLIDGFSRLGAQTLICIEDKNHQRVGMEKIIADIRYFQPDLVAVIDHFRHEYPGIPTELPFVNWIQDMLPNITQNSIAPGQRDFNFSFAKRWLSFNQLDIYREYPLEFLPLGYNDSQYHPLAEQGFDCDILLVSHLESPEKTLECFRNSAFGFVMNPAEQALIDRGELTQQTLHRLYQVLEQHCASMTMAQFEEFCTFHLGKTTSDFRDLYAGHGLAVSDQVIDVLLCTKGNRLHFDYLNRMKTWPIQLLARSFPELEIHVYGKNWQHYPAYRRFAKGVADNGKALNKIMSKAKICLNSNPGVTLHMRALEIMASGSFMLSRRMVYDGSPLADFFSADEVVLYDDEADFLVKVVYFLDNPAARAKFAANGLLALQAKLSYQAIAGSILKSVISRLDKKVIT
ncbi:MULTISPECIES: glycosyltransferase [Methylomonas]|uniref:Spore protein YkvP/CgeB glycosyl transferase-like domain-containing protein n=2 Tax=Methylomonas TaxID=416 RepID=A0A126T6P8_9GAMM|nr:MULTISPECIES: glycosyltransferase [Methylomonas]AMK77751.1 hypothetical protein JT25_014920 [Methylomonas denitrificans]OAI08666.1 hypothetical protein A1342_16010 [Methylomonas methanica]TCV86924.1 glycosyl transferase family 1 [Methylomonas methanica]